MATLRSSSIPVPHEVLLEFFSEATQALQSCQIKDNEPLSFPECRRVLLEEQRRSLEKVVEQHNNQNSTSEPQQQLTLDQVQESLEKLAAATDSNSNEALRNAMQTMNDTARLAFARLVLASECLRSSTSSLNYIPDEQQASDSRREPLKTSRMTRSELLEFCALCKAVVRLENVHNHLVDANQPLWDDLDVNEGPEASSSSYAIQRSIPPIKRVENLQRLLLQAMGYDADMGMKEMGQRLQTEQDDVELVQAIRQSTSAMMESLLGDFDSARQQNINNNNNNQDFLSDLHEGGVTRIVSVQHSETVIDVDDNAQGSARTMGAAPLQQSMHDNSKEEWDMARQAAALRESLAQELDAMSEDDRADLLQKAEQALHDFQEQAMQRPAGPERVEFLRSMNAETQKLLAMHRIWQEKHPQQR